MTQAVLPDSTREFEFTPADFERVRKLIYQRAGIALAPSKQDMVYSRLARRLRARQIDSFKAYLDDLDDPLSAEWEAFVNALTTNLTSFFREAHHFDRLYELLLKQTPGSEVLLWSSASSTGEEPYSMAITVMEALDKVRLRVRILATDLDTNVLETARQGVYALDRIEKLSEERKRRFFLRGSGSAQGYVRVRDELRAMVSFQQLNLLDPQWPLKGPFTVIFCRNVMIYFDKPTQYRVLQKMVPLLTPDGLLFTGHSESFFHATDLIQPCGRTIYRRAR
ncbi:chemotaxis protein methyltransferase CheR [Solimonas aquatica]|uniref:Chemotaxis protein methyltransferase n=1 Tax=Solimonas aquatica TaxID=489703 RepID=A0A1H9ARH2_9GAMM|nr:CheR family methyltransferase [Solimonas aquatica]SEP79320.1 chemotaxis protein methyltransferase CheR [Solimonas aquatica]